MTVLSNYKPTYAFIVGTQEKKEAAERERTERIKEQEIENLSGSRHLELQKLKSILKTRGFALHEVPKIKTSFMGLFPCLHYKAVYRRESYM